jgi:WD40 repeat protein
MPTVIRAHEYGVFGIDWSPDGSLLISAGGDGLIKTWDTADWQRVDEFLGSDVTNEAANSLDWSPDGDYLAIGDLAGGVWVLAVENGEVEHSWAEQGDQISMVAWSPDESQVAAASRDGTILLGNRDEGTAVLLEGHSDQVTAVAWSPDGDRVASASLDQTVRVWDVESGEVLFVLEGHHELVTAVAWSPNGEIIASGGWDWNIHLWNAETGRPLQVLAGHVAAVNSVAWSPDGSVLASASEDGTVMIWGIRAEE